VTESLLPRNATAGEVAIEGATARIGDVPIPLRTLWNPDTCPAAFLPWLAWALSIDAWQPYWPESIKRARIRAAIEVQRRKGTIGAVRTIVEAFGGSCEIREWWQMDPPGIPHTFELFLSLSGEGGAPSAAFVDDVIGEVTRTKPLRSHFNFTQGVNAEGSIGVVGAGSPALFVRLQLDQA
jgi:phage tail P2-like protein